MKMIVNGMLIFFDLITSQANAMSNDLEYTVCQVGADCVGEFK